MQCIALDRQKLRVSAGNTYLMICAEWADDHFAFVRCKSIMKICAKNNFRTQWPWLLSFVSLQFRMNERYYVTDRQFR